jgi:hypothetical protein
VAIIVFTVDLGDMFAAFNQLVDHQFISRNVIKTLNDSMRYTEPIRMVGDAATSFSVKFVVFRIIPKMTLEIINRIKKLLSFNCITHTDNLNMY